MMPWPYPLRALEAVAGEGESVNSYREENFSLLCELVGLPGGQVAAVDCPGVEQCRLDQS